jgi:hypothetical protein
MLMMCRSQSARWLAARARRETVMQQQQLEQQPEQQLERQLEQQQHPRGRQQRCWLPRSCWRLLCLAAEACVFRTLRSCMQRTQLAQH